MNMQASFARQNVATTTAVFIDADNIAANHAPDILKAAGKAPRLIRAYGNAATAKAWEGHPAVELIHTGTGKNASDLALAVDALDAAHSYELTHVYISSSDGDFRHLARRLRALGIEVIGMGVTEKASKLFRAACSEWVTLEERAKSAPSCTTLSEDALQKELQEFIRIHSKQGKGVPISKINKELLPILAKQDTTAGKRWRVCLNDPARFAIDKKDFSGVRLPDPMVRFLPEGFATPPNAPRPSSRTAPLPG